jgi:hypothetical protein
MARTGREQLGELLADGGAVAVAQVVELLVAHGLADASMSRRRRRCRGGQQVAGVALRSVDVVAG